MPRYNPSTHRDMNQYRHLAVSMRASEDKSATLSSTSLRNLNSTTFVKEQKNTCPQVHYRLGLQLETSRAGKSQGVKEE